MNTCFQIAAFARSQWALGSLLNRTPGAQALATQAFQEARNAAWAYGWGASDTPSELFNGVPDLLNAFKEGQDTLKLDLARAV